MVASPQADDQAPLWQQWSHAAARPDVSDALTDLYRQIDAAIQQRGPTCWATGRCCKFDTFEGGHLLYVTGLEIAWVLAQPTVRQSGIDPAHVGPEGACAFQINGLCSIHAVRPLGCRVFFCQQGTQDWQNDLYETFLTQLRQLHDRHGLDYRYMEWRNGLAQAVQVIGMGDQINDSSSEG